MRLVSCYKMRKERSYCQVMQKVRVHRRPTPCSGNRVLGRVVAAAAVVPGTGGGGGVDEVLCRHCSCGIDWAPGHGCSPSTIAYRDGKKTIERVNFAQSI